MVPVLHVRSKNWSQLFKDALRSLSCRAYGSQRMLLDSSAVRMWMTVCIESLLLIYFSNSKFMRRIHHILRAVQLQHAS